jgi:hypothetical protein
MTLLTIVQEAAGALSLPVPTAIVGASDASAILWFNLAKREGKELSRRHDWQNLVVEKTWTSTATVTQADAIGSDFDHPVPDVEIWNRTSNLRYIGPVSSIEWGRLQTGVAGGIIGWWRIIGNVLNIFPAPTAGQTIAWEYISRNWCQSAAAVRQSTWVADTDTSLISEDLMSLGLTWRWLRAKGMDYAEEMATYERDLERTTARSRALRVMSVGKTSDDDEPPQPYWSGTVSG